MRIGAPPWPRARRSIRAALALWLAASSSGCEEDCPPADRPAETAYDCASCHGSTENAAPPADTAGVSSTDSVTVGAHQSHLQDSEIRIAVACEECHVVPEATEAPGHIDTPPAEFVPGLLASSGGLDPVWDPVAGSCADTWCHGAALTGGTNTAPTWTTVDGSEAACGTCHGAPPPLPHPQDTGCQFCHPDTMDGEDIDIEGGYHINGAIEALDLACDSCHGSNGDSAPPADTLGNDDVSARGVGTHQAHLTDGDIRLAIECGECHVVPVEIGDPGHIDPAPAEFVPGRLATAVSSPAEWDPDSGTCRNYCHGERSTGGTLTRPVWTTADGSQAACGTCHGIPPTTHPNNLLCVICHPATVQPGGIDVQGGKHINGEVEVVGFECDSCHGGDGLWNPPMDTRGQSDPHLVTVGAHESHLTDGDLRTAVDCEECHVVPSWALDEGHIDLPPSEVFQPAGPLASAEDVVPEWDRETGSCANTYCHGATLGGGTLKTPEWTVLDGSQAECGTCHGVPPPAPHPQSTSCIACHPETVIPGGIDVQGGTHIDGLVQSIGNACTLCHLDPIDNGQGPDNGRRGVVGEFPVSPAHGHLAQDEVSDDDCEVCHGVTTHQDGYVELIDPDDASLLFFVFPTDDFGSDPDISDFCMGCHDTDGALRLAEPMDPFGNGNTPPEVATRFQGTLQWNEWYGGDWCFSAEGTFRGVNSHHDVSYEDQQFSGARIECLSCHGSHNSSSADKVGDPYDTTVPWTGTTSAFCLACHHGGAGPEDPALPPGVDPPLVEVEYDSEADWSYGEPCDSPYADCSTGSTWVSGLRPFDSCDYDWTPWYVQYDWSHMVHGGDSKRRWQAYYPTSGTSCTEDAECVAALGDGWRCDPNGGLCIGDTAPTANMECTVCHDPHGSWTPENPAGNPYMIRDEVDGAEFVDDGSRYYKNWLGPLWDTFGQAGTVEIAVDGWTVEWGSSTGLCPLCHSDWENASPMSHYCTGCQTCHGHGQAWQNHDWGGNGNDTPCPYP